MRGTLAPPSTATRFGLKLALLLHGHDGSNQEPGENYATFTESRSVTFSPALSGRRGRLGAPGW